MLLWIRFVFLFGVAVSYCNAMQIMLQFGERKCFSEEVPTDYPIAIDFHTAAGENDMDLDLFVTDTVGRVRLHKSGLSHLRSTLEPLEQEEETYNGQGKASFTTYRFCLMHQTIPGQVAHQSGRRVEFNIQPLSYHVNRTNPLTHSHVGSTREKLAEMEHEIMSLMQKIDVLREQERVLTDMNEGTSHYLLRISSITSLIVLGTGYVQISYLRDVLRKRKFIWNK